MMRSTLVLALGLASSCSVPRESTATSVAASDVRFEVVLKLPEPGARIGSGSEDGWSSFDKLHENTIYVSSSEGSDRYTGETPAQPVRTIAEGMKRLRDGRADWLLLKRGDRFEEGFGQWRKSGLSADAPMVIGSYGEAEERPLLLLEDDSGIVTHGGGGSPPGIDHIALVGIHFRALRPRGEGEATGISWHQPSTNFLIEDCVFESFSTGIVIQPIGGRHQNIQLRRSVIVDSFNTTGGNPQGIYVVGSDQVLIEECVFDGNGWKPDFPGAGADIYSHNLYIDTDNSGLIVRGNIIASGASHGIQLRCGGLCEDNLLLRNSIALMMAGRAGPKAESAVARNNVILEGKNIDDANPRGWGIDFNNVVSGEMTGNIVAHLGEGDFPVSILLDGNGTGKHVHNLLVKENLIYAWNGAMQIPGGGDSLGNIRVQANRFHFTESKHPAVELSHLAASGEVTFSENEFSIDGRSGWVDSAGKRHDLAAWLRGGQGTLVESPRFVDPERSVAKWNALQGGDSSHEAFLAEARKQSRANWRSEYRARAVNAWIREGFRRRPE